MKKQLSSTTLALLLFTAIFGMTNIPSNYAKLGNSSITWFIILAIYFIPLALIIAELSSYNANSNAGMNSWIKTGINEKWAFLGSWAYFVANVFYIPMVASRVPITLSWMFANFDSLNEVVVNHGDVPGVLTATQNQEFFLFLSFLTVIIAIIIGIYFEKIFEKIGKVIGYITIITTLIFIFLAIGTIFLSDHHIANPITLSNLKPTLSIASLSTFAWILFAISGIETVGNYVGRMNTKNKSLPHGIILAAILVSVGYILGFIAMTFILTPEQVPTNAIENYTPIMFAAVGSFYGFGPIFLKIIMFLFTLINLTAVVLWLVSTVSVLFDDFPSGILPDKLINKKVNNIPLFGILMTGIMILFFLIISNSSSTANIYLSLYNMTTMAILLPYVLIIISYIGFKRKNISTTYQMTKNNTQAYLIALFILIITIFAIIFSSYDLTITDLQERLIWLKVSAGGLIFFLLIGYAIYLFKTYKNIGLSLLLFLFISAGYLFAHFFYFIALIIIFIYFITSLLQKKHI